MSSSQLPSFSLDGLLPKGEYRLTLEDLRSSMLVQGPGQQYPNWNAQWRLKLVDNLEILVNELWKAGVDRVFINGSFVEDKDSPGDIDGYFVCQKNQMANGDLERRLNLCNQHGIWTWDPARRTKDPITRQNKLPMWHRYHVELFPEYGLFSGIVDEFGNDQKLPAAFRKNREHIPKGIVRIVKKSQDD